MANDMDLLKTDSVKRLFDTLEITSIIDLHGVTFSNEIETGSLLISQQLSTRDTTFEEENHLDSTSTPIPTVPSNPLNQLNEESTTDQLNKSLVNDKNNIEQNSEISTEMESLITLVKDEVTLQRALALEKRALMTRGTFIPLLKFDMKGNK